MSNSVYVIARPAGSMLHQPGRRKIDTTTRQRQDDESGSECHDRRACRLRDGDENERSERELERASGSLSDDRERRNHRVGENTDGKGTE